MNIACLRSWLRAAFINGLYRTGLTAWARRRLQSKGAVVVLMFHRVLSRREQAESSSLAGIVISDVNYTGLLEYLKRTCEPVDLSHGEPVWRSSSKPRVAITFDDGWVDNRGVAFEASQACRVPITIFVCPGITGHANPFWPEHTIALLRAAIVAGEAAEVRRTALVAYMAGRTGEAETRIESTVEMLKTLPPNDRDRRIEELASALRRTGATVASGSVDATLGWREIRELAAAGVTFGSHTQTHQILTTIPADRVDSELQCSARDLHANVEHASALFAYPNGSWSPDVRDAVARAGYTLAFTTEPRAWTPDCDPLLIPRINIWEGSVTNAAGEFSPAMVEYVLFWKPYLAARRAIKRAVTAPGLPAEDRFAPAAPSDR